MLGGSHSPQAEYKLSLSLSIYIYMTPARDPKQSVETSGRHLGDTWEASGDTWEAPGDSPRPPGLQRRPGGKISQIICVLSKKVARATILAESGEGGYHQVLRIAAKVGGRRGRADPVITPPSL